MGSLDLVARLAKQDLDRQRQALHKLNTEIVEAEQRIADLTAAMASEAARPLDFMTTGATLAAYIQASRQRIETSRAHLSDLLTRQKAQLAELQKKRLELKRYETLAERRTRQARAAAVAKEQKVIDELVAIKAGRPSND